MDIPSLDDYEKYVGAETVDRISKKAENLQGFHLAHVNSTYYGGGVAEILSSLSLLMASVGIKTGWRTIQGSPDYFSITKKMHNALQGGDINLTEKKKQIYEHIIFENSIRNHLDHNMVIIHDPQPLPMVELYRKNGPWVWRCHIDVSNPHQELWNYLRQFIEQYDATIFSLKEYKKELRVPQVFFMPAIDPFALKNQEMSENEMDERLEHYNIPTDLPIVTQISRFDRWKDPAGVIEAFKQVRKDVDATLVLLGNVATDDPEGEEVFESLLRNQDERIILISQQDSALVNTLQRRAAVVMQKSIREGFGLTVAEAMWKGTPVIGGNTGGIRYQIKDGENGYLVDSVDDAAERLRLLLKDEKLRQKIGEAGSESAQKNFMLSRLLEQYIDLINSFETLYRLKI